MTNRPVSAIAVGVPARDEAVTIGACLRAVGRAAAECGLPVSVAVAADTCTDDTVQRAEIALQGMHGIVSARVVSVERGAAGATRDDACGWAIEAHELPTDQIWLATTDADSTVPPDWLRRQLAWAALGADGVAGMVRVDRSASRSLRRRVRRHLAHLGDGHDHPHVFGANLGVRADLWASVGGFEHVAVGEDQALWRALRAHGADLVAASDGVVTTSGRLVGRAPTGFAAVLASLAGANSLRRAHVGTSEGVG